MIKILYTFFLRSDNGYVKGYQRFDILVELLRKKYETWVLAYKSEWKSIRDLLLGKINIDKNSKIITLTKPRWASSLDAIFDNIFLAGIIYSIQMLIICKKFNFNTIVLADDKVSTNFYFLLLKKILRFKINTIIDYQDLTARLHTYKSKNKLKRFIGILLDEIINPRLAGKLITITEYGKNYLHNRSGVKKIFVVRELIQPNNDILFLSKKEARKELGLPMDGKIIIWCGFLHGQASLNNILPLLEALRLSKFKEDITLIIMGSYDLYNKKKLLELAKKNSLNVILTGYISNQSHLYWKYLRASDIGYFYRPGADYGRFVAGIKIAEYITAGLPVLLPCLEGPTEVLKGNGICFDPDDPMDLVKKIDEMFMQDLESMGKRSLEIAEEMLSPNALEKIIMSKEFEEFIENIV